MDDAAELTYLQLTDMNEVLSRPGWPADPPPGVHLRAADPGADIPLIAELYNAAFAYEPLEKVTIEEVAHYAQHPGLAPFGVFLAMEGNLAVGMVVGRVDVPAPGGDEHRGAIELLAVRPGYRRRGIGRALVHRALAWLAEQGVAMVGIMAESALVFEILKGYGFRAVEPPA